MNHPIDRLLRLPQVLELVPVSKSTWWLGVRDGRFPKPVKLGLRTTCWRESEILALFNRSADETQAGEENSSEKSDMANNARDSVRDATKQGLPRPAFPGQKRIEGNGGQKCSMNSRQS